MIFALVPSTTIYNVFLPGVQGQTVFLIPSHTTANAGEEVVFTCSGIASTESPMWIINGTSYFPTELPLGFVTNDVNLTFVAYVNISIQCGFGIFSASGVFTIVYSDVYDVIVQENG